jgi:ankyrin repeat protein
LCRVLLERGAEIRRQDSNGQTALHLAVKNGSKGLIKLLLKDNDPNVKDDLGRTALFQAVQSENEMVTKQLLDAHIDVNSKDTFGEVALHLAVESGSESLSLLLLEYGADVDA